MMNEQFKVEKDFFRKKEFVSFVLSIFVIMLHNQSAVNYKQSESLNIINYWLSDSFVRIAVPLFFILSGFSFFRNYQVNLYKSKLHKRIKTLVVPYLLWNIIWMIFNMTIAYTPLTKFFIGREIAKVTVLNVFLGIFHYQYASVNWYVFALIVFFILAPLWDSLSKTRCSSILSLFAIYLVFNQSGIEKLLGKFLFDYTSIIYFFVGVVIAKYCRKLFEKRYGIKQIIVAVGIFIVCLWIKGYVDLNNYKNTYLTTFLLILAALMFWIAMDFFVVHIKPHNIYRHSFFIYEAHKDILSCVVKLVVLILPKAGLFYLITYFSSTIITLAIIELSISFLSKNATYIYKCLSGNRG